MDVVNLHRWRCAASHPHGIGPDHITLRRIGDVQEVETFLPAGCLTAPRREMSRSSPMRNAMAAVIEGWIGREKLMGSPDRRTDDDSTGNLQGILSGPALIRLIFTWSSEICIYSTGRRHLPVHSNHSGVINLLLYTCGPTICTNSLSSGDLLSFVFQSG